MKDRRTGFASLSTVTILKPPVRIGDFDSVDPLDEIVASSDGRL